MKVNKKTPHEEILGVKQLMSNCERDTQINIDYKTCYYERLHFLFLFKAI